MSAASGERDGGEVGRTLHSPPTVLLEILDRDLVGFAHQGEPGTVAANPNFPNIIPAITYGGSEKDIEWSTISPRIGLTYALGAEKKTLLRAAANRYVDQLGGSTVYAASPLSCRWGAS